MMEGISKTPCPRLWGDALSHKYLSTESIWVALMVTYLQTLVILFEGKSKDFFYFYVNYMFVNLISDTVEAYESGELAKLLNISQDEL